MFRSLKLAIIAGLSLMLADGAAHATQVGDGTLTFGFAYNPSVSTVNDTVNMGGLTFYFGGSGFFSNFNGTGTSANDTLTFSSAPNGTVDYSGVTNSPLDQLFTFTYAGDTYYFNLDGSITTTAYSYTPGVNGTGALGLFLLGDITDSLDNYSATAAALTLTLNETGGSAWSMSGTLATPPPGTAPVPEPASVALLGAGLAGLGFLRRRRKQA